MSANLTTDLTERPHYAAQEKLVAPSWFSPILPVVPVSPAAPSFPGTLTPSEAAQVNSWLLASQNDRERMLRSFTSRLAIAKVAEFVTYYADPAIKAWIGACEAARIAQFRQYMADAMVNNKGSTSLTALASGLGASAPVATQPVTPDV